MDLIKKIIPNYSSVSKDRLLNLYDQCMKFKNTEYSFVECGVGYPDITDKDIGSWNKADPRKVIGKCI